MSSNQALTKIKPIIFPFLFLLIISSLIYRIVFVPMHYSIWAFGDAQSYNAGVHFAREGFFAHYFLPMVSPGVPNSLIPNNGPNGHYANYPMLEPILNGLGIKLANRLGIHDDQTIRRLLEVFYVFCTSIGVLAMYFALLRLYNGFIASLFSLYWLSSPWVTGFGDSPCDQPLDICFLGLLAFFLVKSGEIYFDRRFFLPLAVVCFLISRNGIEIGFMSGPFCLIYLLTDALGRGRSLSVAIKFWIVNVVLPILVGLGLHIWQGYLDFGNSQSFYNHWRAIFEAKGNLKTSLEPLRFWSFLASYPYNKLRFIILMIFIFLGGMLFIVALRKRKLINPEIFNKIGFPVAFSIGALAFPIIFVIQVSAMSWYSTAYIYLPFFLCSLVFLMDRGIIDSYAGNVALLRPYLRIGCFSMASILIAFGFITIVKPGLALLVNPLDITSNSPLFWNVTRAQRAQIAIISRSDVRSAIKEVAAPNDILIFPPDYATITKVETSSILELYLQRHAIVRTPDQLPTLLLQLKLDQPRMEKTFRYYSVPNIWIMPLINPTETGKEIAMGMKQYDPK